MPASCHTIVQQPRRRSYAPTHAQVDNTSLLGMAPGSPPASVAPDSSSDSATQSELMQLAVVASCDQSAPPCDRTACDLADALAAAAESLFQSSQRLSDAVPVLRSIRLPDSGAVRAAGLGALESSAEVSRNTAHLLSLVKSITSHESTQHAGEQARRQPSACSMSYSNTLNAELMPCRTYVHPAACKGFSCAKSVQSSNP